MTIARRLYVVLGIMVLLISAELSALWFTIHTMSAVRAYVAGEGLWSKAEKDAAYHLEAYGRTRDPAEYRAYRHFLEVWAGDHEANLALASRPVDERRATAGFVRGANDPADVPGMIALFTRFGRVSFIADAIVAWTQGDAGMIRFQQLGAQLHAEVLAGAPNATIDRTLSQIADQNAKLTAIEDRFSDTLGRGSRWLTGIVLDVVLAAALIVELTGLLLTAAITRGISLRLRAMLGASARISRGDFSVRLEESRQDEIGRLASAFNAMTAELEAERQRAEDAVAAREAHLREAQRLANIGVWEWTFASDVVVWSKEVCRLHGLAADGHEFVLADFSAVVDPRDAARVAQAARAAAESGLPLSIDYRCVAARGERSRWLCAEATVERDEDGRAVRMVGTTRDVTERKHAEKLRAQSASFGERALATSDVAALESEASELIAEALGAPFVWLGSLDAMPDPAVASSVLAARPIVRERLDEKGEWNLDREARAHGATTSAVVPIRGQTAVRGVLYVGLADPDTFGEDDLSFLLSIGTIIGMATDRERYERSINRLNLELQQRLAELETFSYSVAHDLRAPLRTIAGFASALEEDYAAQLDDEGRRFIGLIERGSAQMGSLIDALLSLARVSRHELKTRPVDLAARARAILADLRASEPERTVRFEIAGDVRAMGDPDLLGTALANLLGNAWKFTRGRPDATIRFSAQSRAGETVYAISDNGAGFPSDRAEDLFAPFKRLHGTAFEGTGIGLATVARIVQRHGGRVWAESVEGEGATFSFTLGAALREIPLAAEVPSDDRAAIAR